MVDKREAVVGLRPSFSSHVRFGERGAPVGSLRICCRSSSLTQDCGGYAQPPVRGVEIGLHAEDMEEDEEGKGVEIDLVDAAVDDEVAENAEENQGVYSGWEEGCW